MLDQIVYKYEPYKETSSTKPVSKLMTVSVLQKGTSKHDDYVSILNLAQFINFVENM